MLPSSLAEAMELAKHSDFVQSILPERLLTCFLEAKGAEWRSYEKAVDPFEASRKAYFLTT
jgi:glutamine synthetase